MKGLSIGGNFAFQNGLDLTMKTASTNSPRAYIWEGLFLEGYLCLKHGRLIYLFIYFILFYYYYFFFGGGAYYRNFTV